MILRKCLKFLKQYYFLLVPVFITAVCILFFHPYYDIGKDDIVLSNMVNSAKTNEHSEFLVFISIYLGYFMRFFALMFPSLNIYEITMLISFTGAFVALFYNTRQYKNKLLSGLVLAALQVFLLFGITFTIVAFLCSAAGILLVLENVKRLGKRSVKYFLLAFLLIFVGLGYRRGSLATCVFLVFVPTLFFAVKYKRNSLAVALAVVVLFSGTHQLLKTSQSMYVAKLYEGTDYVAFNRYRGIASDSGDLYYRDHPLYFHVNHISEADVTMYRSFRFNDKTMFPVEKVKALAESLDPENKYQFDIGKVLAQSFEGGFIRLFLLAGVFCFIVLRKNRWEVLGDIACVMTAVIYLHFRKRGIGRVVNPIVFIGYLLLLFRFLGHEVSKTQTVVANSLRYGVMTSLLVFALILPLCSHVSGYYWFLEREEKSTSKIVQHIREDQEHKYVSFASLSSMRNLSLTRQEPISPNLISNVYVGWMVYTPYWYDLLEQHGIAEYKDCLYLSLLDPRIKILCTSPGTVDNLDAALEDNYGITVRSHLGMIRNGRQIYTMWQED